MEPISITHELLERYLSGEATPEELAVASAAIEQDVSLRNKVEAMQQMDSSLRRLAPCVTPSFDAALQRILHSEHRRISERTLDKRRFLGVGLAAVAAAAAVVMLTFSLRYLIRRAPRPVFRPEPLAAIYNATVRDGFEPYYECKDVDRFEKTFRKRQGKSLWLKRPPHGLRMVGLSYSGGVGPNTTAMLCYADGRPLMVFVDKKELDRPKLIESATGDVHVFREEKFGLVFYEVTPFETPRALGLFTDQYADGAAFSEPITSPQSK